MLTYSEEICEHVTASECDCEKCPKCSAKIKKNLLAGHLETCIIRKNGIYMEEHPGLVS